MASDDEIQTIESYIDAANEVSREAVVIAARVAKEREIRVTELLHMVGWQLQSATMPLRFGRTPPKPGRPKQPRRRKSSPAR